MQKTSIRKNNKNFKESYSDLEGLVKRNILGVGVTDDTKENILEFIHQSIKKPSKPYYIVTPNPEMIVLANKNSSFRQVLNNAKIALNDGVGVSLAAGFMGKSLKERFTGVQLVENLCEKSNDWPITVGFLGGGPNVAEKAVECLLAKNPNLKIAFVGQEWGNDGFDLARKYKGVSIKYKGKNQKSLNTLYSSLNTGIDVLFIALGAPKQEFWMAEHVGKIPVKVMVGVGGAFDYLSGVVVRAPLLVRRFGFEWLFRLIRQPWRWKRQLALLEFVGMVFFSVISK